VVREICLCGAPAEQVHHWLYRQHVTRHGGDLDDRRNLVGLCYDCHRRHHSRHAVIPFTAIPEPAREFAQELMGDHADDYLHRRYA
jgi:5-methylcytosine-specific restriction endonuclease McrA